MQFHSMRMNLIHIWHKIKKRLLKLQLLLLHKLLLHKLPR
jgi:hypothetical protein